MTGEAGEGMQKREEKTQYISGGQQMPAEIRMQTESPGAGTAPKPSVPNANSFVQQTARKAQHTECPGKAADKARL